MSARRRVWLVHADRVEQRRVGERDRGHGDSSNAGRVAHCIAASPASANFRR